MGFIYTKKRDERKDEKTIPAEDFLKRCAENQAQQDKPQELPRTEILKD